MALRDDRKSDRQPDDRSPQPSLRPTRLSTLFVAGLATAALSWLAISRFYGDLPTDIPWLPALTLLAMAALELGAAVNTKARIDRRAGAPPVDPLQVARYVVLAKASALAASLFTGLYGGLSLWLFTEQGRLKHAATDLPPAVVGLVGSAALVLAALTLERACRVPPPPPSSDPSKPGWADEADEAEPDAQEADS
jgi:hypothetical protein